MGRFLTRCIAMLAGISLCPSIAASAIDATGAWRCQSTGNIFEWIISSDGQGKPNVEKSSFGFTLTLIDCSQYVNKDGVAIDCSKVRSIYPPLNTPLREHKLIGKITDMHGDPPWYKLLPDSFLWPDETFIDVKFDEVGVQSVNIYNYRGDIYLEMHRDYSNWQFVTSQKYITTREEAKHFQMIDPKNKDKVSARSLIASYEGVCARLD